jgi:hypothetical protein
MVMRRLDFQTRSRDLAFHLWKVTACGEDNIVVDDSQVTAQLKENSESQGVNRREYIHRRLSVIQDNLNVNSQPSSRRDNSVTFLNCFLQLARARWAGRRAPAPTPTLDQLPGKGELCRQLTYALFSVKHNTGI